MRKTVFMAFVKQPTKLIAHSIGFGLVVLLFGLLGTGSAIGADDGTEQVYRVGFGARAIGLGGAFTSISGDPISGYYNPAGLGSIDRLVIAGDIKRFSRYTHSGFGVAAMRLPGTETVLALSVQRIQDRKNLDEFRREISVYDDSKTQYQASVGHEFPLGIALGLSAKINNRLAEGESLWGSTVDLGLRYPINENWALGGSFNDVISFKDIDVSAGSASPKVRAAVGASYTNNAVGQWQLMIAADLLSVEGEDSRLLFGVEAVHDLWREADLFLRSGYNGEGLTAGAGFGADWWRFDYALAKTVDGRTFDDYSHTVSLTIQPLRLIPQSGPNPDSVLAQYRGRRYADLMSDGREYMRRGEYRRARQSYDQAAAFAENGSAIEAERAARRASDSVLAEAARDLSRTHETQLAEIRNRLQNQLELRTDSLAMQSRSQTDSLQRELNQVLRLAGEHIQAYYTAADELLREREYEAADRLLDRLEEGIEEYIQQAPSSREAMQETSWDIKELRQTIGDRRQAEETQAIRAAEQAEEMDSLVIAIEHYNRALELDPDNDEALAGRRKVVQRIANLIIQWRTSQTDSVGQTPKTDAAIQMLYQEGLNYYRNGEYQKAIDTWEKVLRANPSHPSVAEDIATAKSRLESEQ